MSDPATVTDADIALLREAIRISQAAVAHGNHPFGALLSDAGGLVMATAENSVTTESDVTCHAETNLVRTAAARGFSAAELAGCTLYTSCEPCAMCSGAIYWAGIGRVVYALAETSLLGLTGTHPQNPTLQLPCRVVFGAGDRETAVAGPAIEAEAAQPHRGFWH
jgi:tRNA(Arg) A34 adenosine deaminase TadA